MTKAEKGILDLSSWNFREDRLVNLDGEWGFWWNEIKSPEDPSLTAPGLYVSVPSIWTKYEIEGRRLSAQGFGTYSMLLIPPDGDHTLGIYIKGEGSAFSLWINNRLLVQRGRIASDPRSELKEKGPLILYFESDGKPLRFVMQMSNDQHRKGGFRSSILMGRAEDIHSYHLKNWFLDAFSFGILLIMGLYHLIIYFFRKMGRPPLYFAILCFMAALRLGVTNQSILLTLFPLLSWTVSIRLEYFVFFLSPLFFVLFFNTLFPGDIHRWFIRTVTVISILFTLIGLFIGTFNLSRTAPLYQVVWNLEALYYVFFVIKISIEKRQGALFFALATALFISTVMIETVISHRISEPLRINNLYPLDMITSFGFLSFIFFQAISLASRYSIAFSDAESLALNLKHMNKSLEFSEKKYRTIFEDSKDMIFLFTLTNDIEDCNPACTEILEYSRDELLNIPVGRLLVHPQNLPRHEKAILEQGSVKDIEIELKSKSGRIVSTLLNLTQRKDEHGQLKGFQGVAKDVTARKQVEVERLRAQEFEQMAITDPLTNIHNRRFFNEAVKSEEARARRFSTPLSLILFDIDHFKRINDTYGHSVGDQVLQNLAVLCQETMRTIDLFARFGGEEFVILTPETDWQRALEIADRLRKKVEEAVLAQNQEEDIFVSISLGVASFDPLEHIEIQTVLERADQALYNAKNTGRNKASAWENL